jgi:hypothetical protein
VTSNKTKREDVYRVSFTGDGNLLCVGGNLSIPNNPHGGTRELRVVDPVDCWTGNVNVVAEKGSVLCISVCDVKAVEWRSTLCEDDEKWYVVFQSGGFPFVDEPKMPFYMYWAAVATIVEKHIDALNQRHKMGMPLKANGEW